MVGDLQGVADYRLLGVLGEGDNALVYRAERDTGGEPERALKLRKPRTSPDDPDDDEGELARFEAARCLAHPSIVAVVDSGTVDGRPYQVSELVDGISLEDVPIGRRSGRLKPEPAAVVLHQVLTALEAAATASPALVHGRLDAGDVLLDQAGDTRLRGFGVEGDPRTDLRAVARLAKDLTRQWPVAVYAWLDQLEADEGGLSGPGAALAAFPRESFAHEAWDHGTKSLGRTVRRILRKRGESEGETAAEPLVADPKGVLERERERRRAEAALRQPSAATLRPALLQATTIAWVCCAVVIVALAIEVIRFTG